MDSMERAARADIAIPWKRNLLLLWLGQLLAFVGHSAAIPFIPLYIKYELGIDDKDQLASALTWFNVSSTLCLALISPVWGAVADRYGRKLMLLRAYFGNALVFPLMGFCIPISIYINNSLGAVGIGALVTPFGVLLFTRILASLFSGSGNAAQALIVSTTPEANQGFALGVFSTALWSGQMAGFVVGSVVVDYFGYRIAFIVLGAAYVVSGVINLFVKENFVRQKVQPVQPVNRRRFDFACCSISTLCLLLFIILTALARNMETGYISLKIDDLVGEKKAIGWTAWVSAASAIGGVIAGFSLGKLADKCRPLQLLIPLLAITGALGFVQGASRDITLCGMVLPGVWVLIFSRFLAFIAAGGVEPVLQMLLARITPREHRGSVFGFAMTCRMLGATLGALVSGVLFAWYNTDMVFHGGAIAYLVIVPLLLLLCPLIRRQFPGAMKSGRVR